MIVADNGDICVRWLGLPWQEVVQVPCFPLVSALGQVLAPVAGCSPGICMTLPLHGLTPAPTLLMVTAGPPNQIAPRHGDTGAMVTPAADGHTSDYPWPLSQPLLVPEIGGRMRLWPGDLDTAWQHSPPTAPPPAPPPTRHRAQPGPGIRSRPRTLAAPAPPTPRPSPDHG